MVAVYEGMVFLWPGFRSPMELVLGGCQSHRLPHQRERGSVHTGGGWESSGSTVEVLKRTSVVALFGNPSSLPTSPELRAGVLGLGSPGETCGAFRETHCVPLLRWT